MYDVGGQLLEEIWAFYRDASACVRLNGELSEFSYRIGSETRMCGVIMAV